MANAAYPKFLDAAWNAGFNIGVDTLKVAILGPGYTYDAADEFLSDLTDIIGTATLTGVGSLNGVLFADDTTVTGISAEPQMSVVVYKSTGVAGTSRLIVFYDTGVGFQTTTTGVKIIWPTNATARIFPLGGRAA